MSVVTPCVSPQLARALAARLRDATAAGEQLASFAWSEGPPGPPAAPAPGPELREGEELAAAHDFLLRVLHGASEPVSWQVLAAVAGEPGVALDVLADRFELPRLAIAERVNALIQLGLMTRDLEHDSVTPTPAGTALFELVCELDAEIARWLTKRRRS